MIFTTTLSFFPPHVNNIYFIYSIEPSHYFYFLIILDNRFFIHIIFCLDYYSPIQMLNPIISKMNLSHQHNNKIATHHDIIQTSLKWYLTITCTFYPMAQFSNVFSQYPIGIPYYSRYYLLILHQKIYQLIIFIVDK